MEKKKSKGNIVIGIICILLIILIPTIIYFGIKFYENKKSEIFIKTALNTFISELEDENTKFLNSDTESDTISLSFNGKSTNEDYTEILNILNKIDLTIEMDVDYNDKYLNANVTGTYDNLSMIDLNIYFDTNATYYKLLGVEMDKYVMDEEDALKEEDFVKNSSILNLFKYLNNALKDEYFEVTEEEGCTKTTLILNNNNYNAIVNDVVTNIKNDEDLIALFDVYDITIEDLESLSKDLDKIYYVSVFTNKSGFVKLEVTDDVGIYLELSNTFTKEADSTKYNYTIYSDDTYTGSITIIEPSDLEWKFIVNISTSDFDLSLNLNIKTEYDKKIDKPNITNYISVNDLTESDLSILESKLLEPKGMQNFALDIVGVSGLLEDEFNEYGEYFTDTYIPSGIVA